MEQMLERGSEEREMNVKGNASDLRVEKNKEIFFFLLLENICWSDSDEKAHKVWFLSPINCLSFTQSEFGPTRLHRGE